MSEEKFATYLFEYAHEGALWSIEIKARDEEDARERVRKLAHARYLGVLQMKLPVELGVFAKLICRWKNWRARNVPPPSSSG